MDLVIKDTPGKGKGLFSNTFIDTNHLILRFDGIPIIKRDIKDFSGPIATCYLQIGSELYLDLKGHPSFFINHSCQPNCAIKISINKAFLLSIRPIEKGGELLFDYSTTSNETSDTWSMDCNCSQFYCRKLITGYQSIPNKIKERYLEKGMIPDYLKT